jgi:hypothetical protein
MLGIVPARGEYSALEAVYYDDIDRVMLVFLLVGGFWCARQDSNLRPWD